MFNLDQAIADWRRQMLAAGIKTPVPLEELESHLREDLERQIKSGASVPEAFENAVQQIGHAKALDAEFRKTGVDKLARERKWMRVYCISFPVFYLYLVTPVLLTMEMTSLERTLGFAALALTCLFIWGTQHSHKFLPVIASKPRRLRIQIGWLLLWMVCGGVFMNFILPHLDLNASQLTVNVLWLMTPVAAIGGIGCGLGEAARRHLPAAAT